jgi:putative membrane protein insertion efficiency factor
VNPAQHIIIGLIKAYRLILSPAQQLLFGRLAGCRFEPSCSRYGLEAVQTHGACVGSWLALRRILRCHPWGACGHDPVPPRRTPRHRHSPQSA